MIRFVAMLWLIGCSWVSNAQDISLMLKDAEDTEAIPNETAALDKFKAVLRIRPNNLYALSKCSELCSRIGQRATTKKSMADYYSAATIYAETALKLDPDNSAANCALAIAIGRSALSKSGKEKINTAREIRIYIDKALKTDPNNFKAWHVLGRWHYEICNLNFFERSAVKLLYGGLPKASIKESIFAFEKAQAISHGFILNYFEMARAYKKDGQKAKALGLLKTMIALPNHTEDDEQIKKSGEALLKVWE